MVNFVNNLDPIKDVSGNESLSVKYSDKAVENKLCHDIFKMSQLVKTKLFSYKHIGLS